MHREAPSPHYWVRHKAVSAKESQISWRLKVTRLPEGQVATTGPPHGILPSTEALAADLTHSNHP